MTADLAARVELALALHSEFRIYEECGHRHDDGEPGTTTVDDVGIVCADGLLYVICFECCTNGSGYQTEECCINHPHPCWPCSTARALTEES